MLGAWFQLLGVVHPQNEAISKPNPTGWRKNFTNSLHLMQQESMASFDSSNSNPTHSKVVKIWWIYILRAVKKSWCCGFRPKLSIEQRSVRQNQVDQRPVAHGRAQWIVTKITAKKTKGCCLEVFWTSRFFFMKPVGVPGFSYSLVKTSNYWGSLTLQDLLEIPRARISELWLPELLLLGETALASSLFWRMVSRRLHVIIPAVAVSALNSLGLPPQIGVAIQCFYSNQVRIMKLGKVFGKRLIHGSWALQGCTLSILMVNGIFSGLMAHLNKTCPQVQATTFIDDMKVWAKRENIGMLQSALAEPVEFDRLTGQLVSEEKNNCCK